MRGSIQRSWDWDWHSRGGVHGVSRWTLRDALPVVNDVLVAALLRVLALVVQLLAELEGDAAPALEAVEALGAGGDTPALVEEVPARHALAGVVGLRAAAQTLLMAAEEVLRAGSVLTRRRANCREK